MKTYKTEKHGHLIMLRAFVEGPAGKVYPKLLLDTGSAYTILSQEILEVIGCSPAKPESRQRIITGSGYKIVPVVSVGNFSCLGKSLKDFRILAHTLPFGVYVDGLLGMDFLNSFEIEIRIKNGEIIVR